MDGYMYVGDWFDGREVGIINACTEISEQMDDE